MRWFVLAVISMLAGSGYVRATELSPEVAPPSAVIAVVDVQRIVHESNAGKSIDIQYDKEHQLFSDRVARQESDLDAQEQELNRQRTVLTQSAFDTQRQSLESYSAEVQKAIQQESQANQQAFNDAFARLVGTIRTIIASVAKEQNITIVLPQEQTLYLGNGAIDITDTVLSRLDSKLSSIAVTLPKPEQAASQPDKPSAQVTNTAIKH